MLTCVLQRFPADQFITPSAGTQTSTDELLQAYSQIYSFLGEEQTASIKNGGFYTKLIEPGVRLVGLNTQYGDLLNFWLYYTDNIGPNQTQWLETVMEDARINNEKVVLASHIPCSHNAGVRDSFCLELISVLSKYTDIIKLVLSGHTHSDSWVSWGNMFTQFITPSVTTFSFRNPTFRLFTLDSEWDLEKVDTYYFDLAEANSGNPQWKLEYSLPSAYNMPDLSVDSFNNVAKSLLTNETLWNLFSTYHGASSPLLSLPNTKEEKVVWLCNLSSATLAEWSACVTSHQL